MSGTFRRDDNYVPVAGGVSSTDASAVLPFKIDPVTGRLLVDNASAGGGTVTTISVASANGFAGTVATPTTTPVITLSTTITGLLKGNGTAISAASAGTDYSAGTSALGTGILKSTTITGALTIAVAGDFPTLNQNTTGTAAGLTTGRTISISGDLSYTSPAFDGTGNITAAGTLATVNSNVGSFGSATQVATFTVNGKGLTTAAANVTITPAVGSITGLGTGIATFLATPSSANLLSAMTDKTGTGLQVFGTTPTLVTPILGVAAATSINKVAFTTPATGATLTITDGKTLAATNTLTLSGTDSTIMTFPTTTATIARTDAAQTFTGVQTVTSALNTTPQTLTVTTNAATADISHGIQNFTNSSAAGMTITLTTTSAVDGQFKEVRIFDASAVAQAITWVGTENSTVTAPATSNGSATLPLSVLFQFNSATSKWRCLASS